MFRTCAKSRKDPQPLTCPGERRVRMQGSDRRLWLPLVVALVVTCVMGPLPGLSSGHAAPSNTRPNSSTDYTVTFSETGLTLGSTWSVTLNGTEKSSSTDAISFSEPNGVYYFQVSGPPKYASNLTFGNVTVDGSSVTMYIGFYVSSPVYEYAITFSQSGLPPGLVWSVTLNGSTRTTNSSATNAFQESNGSYPFTVGPVSGYRSDPSSGVVTVAGAPVGITIEFLPPNPQFSVVFTETGLPSGASWSVGMNGTRLSASIASITFSEANGTYPYSVTAPSGWGSNPSEGSARVHGGDLSVLITFDPVFGLSFVESTLPEGTNWSVTLTGTASEIILSAVAASDSVQLTRSSGGATFIQFYASNGTYTYSASAVGYPNATGSLAITGIPAQPATVTFSSQSTPVPPSKPTASGFPPVDYAILGVVVAGALVVAVLAILFRRRQKEPPAFPGPNVQSGPPDQPT